MREVSLRVNDQARGEVRRPVTVVPRVDVAIDPETEVWPAGDRAPRRFTVTLTHGARDTTAGTVTLEVPEGWPAVRPQPFRLVREDERETFSFLLAAPASHTAGAVRVRAVARDAAGRYLLDVGDGVGPITVIAIDGAVTVERAQGGNADVTMHVTADQYMRLLAGRLPLRSALDKGEVTVEGDRTRAENLNRLFAGVGG